MWNKKKLSLAICINICALIYSLSLVHTKYNHHTIKSNLKIYVILFISNFFFLIPVRGNPLCSLLGLSWLLKITEMFSKTI